MIALKDGATVPQNGQVSPEIWSILQKDPDKLQNKFDFDLPETESKSPTPDKTAAEREDEREKDNIFPIDSLPPAMRNYVLEIAKKHNAHDKMGVVALPMLGIMATALGQGVAAQGRDYISYSNLYVYINVPSGGFKSVALDYAEDPLRVFHARRITMFNEQEKPDLLARKKNIEKQIEDMGPCDDDEEGGDDPSELKKLFHALDEVRDKLNPKLAKLEDVTIEKLMTHGIDHGNFFICTDEASIVDGLVSGRYSKGFTNDGPLCKAWSAKDLSRTRQNGDLMYNQRVLGSMVLLGQEHITKKMLQNEHMVKSGFAARFEPPPIWRTRERKVK